jgi:hypothetical protein
MQKGKTTERKCKSMIRHKESAYDCLDKIEKDMMDCSDPEYKYEYRAPVLGKNMLKALLYREEYNVEFITRICNKSNEFPSHKCNDECVNGEWMIIMDNICFTSKTRHITIASKEFAWIAKQLTKLHAVTMVVPVKGRQELLKKLEEEEYTIKIFKGCKYNMDDHGACADHYRPCTADDKIDWMTITDPEPTYYC